MSLMLTLCLAVNAVLMARPVAPDANRQVGVFLRPWRYLAQQYTARPGPHADYVFIAGESILLSLEFSNVGRKSVWLHTKSLPPGDLATFVLVREDGENWRPVPFRLSLAGKPRVIMPGHTVSGLWGDKVELFDGSLEVPLEVISEANRVPGMYRLEVKDIPLTCEPDCQVRNSAGLFRFEVRDASELAARVELLTRRAWNAVVTDSRLKEAEASIAELLKIYPQSVWGHQLRGQVAEARKRWDVAAREYDAALEILRRGDDTLYAQARPADVQDRIAGLRHMRQALKVKFPE
jgi:tetratricopeptide (TPR) repeat protein